MTERTPSGAVKRSLGRFFKLSIALGLVILVMPSSASAQATRTWVSGVGDDVNPCSRTAPCKTFAGAISKTARGGIINCLDPGGFGALTITKSMTIDCRGVHAGMLASGGINAVNINITDTVNDPKSTVVLRGLSIEGHGTTLGLNGIRVTQAKKVKVYDTDIASFSRAGFAFEPTTANTKALLKNVSIEDVGTNGAHVMPTTAGAGSRLTIKNGSISNSGCGVVASNTGAPSTSVVNCGVGTATGGSAFANVFNSEIIDNNTTAGATGSTGVYANGTAGVVRIGGNLITGNEHGIRATTSMFGGVFSFGDNYIFGNTTDGTPTGTVTPARP